MSPSSTIAHYRITSKLGQGGMGEVWRATDTKLNREVAIKILPDVFAQDADRMARFAREAQVLASLNHPNIAAIYGVEERALIMELVEGETLKGPLPVETAQNYARQIAEALEAAHEKGITHRDLKPGNIMVTPRGVVKVLDFGLAAVPQTSAGDPRTSPTLTISPTHAGMILGTAGYMAPEQARGQAVDRRADIWAFGCVLYEMLTGQPAFPGETTTDILAAVVTKGPDLARVPLSARLLLQRCLEKDPKKRLRDIGDAMPLLEDAPQVAAPPRKSRLAWAVSGALAIVTAVAVWAPWHATNRADLPLTRLSVDLGPDALTGINLTAAISPDGRRLVFPARGVNGKQQLATRLLDQAQASLLPGTENGREPFFSPDSQWIGFFASGKLRRISVLGGAPVTLCDAPFPYGASWSEDGTIIAGLNVLSPLSRVPLAGGRPQPVTKLGKGEYSHRWPQILPGGHALLFTATPTGVEMEGARVVAISLPSGKTKTLIAGGYFGRYVPAKGQQGYVLYLHQGVLSAVAFDPVRLEIQGTPLPILEDVAASPIQGGGQFDFSAAPSGHGTLVYLEGKGEAQTWPVMWLGSSGDMQPLIAKPGPYSQPRFSPDGQRLALNMSTSDGSDIFVYELGRETMTQLTFGGHAQNGIWTPDGKHLAFRSSSSDSGIEWIRSDGSGQPQQILAIPNTTTLWSFSPDGRLLALNYTSETGSHISMLPLDTSDPDHPKAGKPEPFLATASDVRLPMFSPDGRWIAYRSNESGANEIYVRPFPVRRGGKWQISTGGGLYAIWSNNGRELFYETTDNRIMVVDYTASHDSFLPGKPRLWSEKQLFYAGVLNLALAPDGKRFAVFATPEAAGPEKGSVHLTFLQNFVDELRRKLP